MTSLSVNAPSAWPAHWEPRLGAHLASLQNALAILEVDLDARLQFVPGLLIVTDRQVVFAHDVPGQDLRWDRWDLAPDQVMRHHDHAGVGTLSLQNAERIAARGA